MNLKDRRGEPLQERRGEVSYREVRQLVETDAPILEVIRQ
jgi:hypothetical protein